MTVEVGSEENITPEDKWISKFSNWDLDDDVPDPSSSDPPVTDEHVHVEASEEGEGDSDDDSGDDDYEADE